MVNDTQDRLFDELAKFPKRAERFASSMSFRATAASKGDEVSHLLDGYPWSELGACTVVDVGGSYGPASIALAQRFPNLNCVVQDLPGTISGCSVPPELEGRLKFMAHDFFTEQPVKGAEIYFFRRIFHDWSDEYAARILRCLIGALKPGAKVLIQDLVVSEYGSSSLYDQKWQRWVNAGGLAHHLSEPRRQLPNQGRKLTMYRYSDLVMLTMLNALERSAEDWHGLVQSADPRFRLSNILQPPFANQGLIEITWCGT